MKFTYVKPREGHDHGHILYVWFNVGRYWYFSIELEKDGDVITTYSNDKTNFFHCAVWGFGTGEWKVASWDK